jgi:hypothetical protein
MPQKKMRRMAGAAKPKRKPSMKSAGRPAPTQRPKKSKPANTPGEGKRGFSGMVNRMVAMANSDFNKMMKSIRTKRR